MIRFATKKDIPFIMPLITIIWHDMSHPLLNLVDTATFHQIMSDLMTQKNSKFSYTNAIVYDDNGIKGILFHYDGALEPTFNQHLIDYMTHYYPHIDTTTLNVPNETTYHEWYIDSVVVDSHFRGCGIGRLLIRHVLNMKNITKKIALNCEYDNIRAYQLYTQLGFKHIGDTQFLGHTYKRLHYLP